MRKEEFSLNVDGLKIVGEVYCPSSGGPHPALVLCHGIPSGNPKNPGDGGYPVLAERFVNHGFIVQIFNFRGAGLSEGHFDMLGWTRDLAAAIDYIYDHSAVDRQRISVMGFSGGARASVYAVAQDKRVSALVSCCCPIRVSFAQNRQQVADFIERQRLISISRDTIAPETPGKIMETFEKTDSLKAVDRISPRPLLIVHGDRDEVVDHRQAYELYEAAKEPRELAIIKGAGHRLRLEEEAMRVAEDWLKKVNRLA